MKNSNEKKANDMQLQSRATLLYLMELHQMRIGGLAKVLCISERTARNRINDPSTFTVAELRMLIHAFKLDASKVFCLVGGGE